MAAVDYFLHVDGVAGESQDAQHRGAIQLSQWRWSAYNTGTMRYGSGGGAGRARFDDFCFTMRLSTATPKLMQKLASGEHVPKAVLVCRKAGTVPREYLRVTFEDVVVSNYTTGSVEDGDVIPIERVTLNFAKVTFEYREQRADGTLGGAVVASHDLKQNRTT